MTKEMIHEILEIPEKAWFCYENSRHISLPSGLPYLGMGSSYFAALTLKYCGIEIYPEIASEYYNYLSSGKISPLGVLISQSGESSETLWCSELFQKVIAITNEAESSLARSPDVKEVILLNAGREDYSSTKTYINTLVVLYNGFGIDIRTALENIDSNLEMYREWGEKSAMELGEYIRKEKINGITFIGSGPNIATSCQAALTFSETTKMSAAGLALSQYDHGPKESSAGSIIFLIQSEGTSFKRTTRLAETLSYAGAQVIPVGELSLPEILSPFTTIFRINFLSFYLAKELGIKRTFDIGGKITRVE
jgi:glucosamine--fructose-6-phosphate aminotransferase (isomerizing)